MCISWISIPFLIFFTYNNKLVVDAECNVCQANRAACVNSTSFYMCFGNSVPNYDKIYHCKKGFDCSSLNAICVQSLALRPASCSDTTLCGLCSAHTNHLFACTSRTTFRMCYGASHPKSSLRHCPDGYICNAKTNSICVQEALQKVEPTCDLLNPIESYSEETSTKSHHDQPITSSTTKPLLPSLTAQDVCDVEQKLGVFQIPGDKRCLEYVRCYIKKNFIYGSFAKCPSGTYFNGEILQCVLAKPSYCF